MDHKKLLAALKQLKVQTGSLACLGCGYEHACDVHGCAIIREAMAHLETQCPKSLEPLTPEHLRERVGQWVWVEVNYDHDGELFQCDGWAFVPTPAFVSYLDQTIPIDFYGKKFLAYDYPPVHKEE